MLKNVLTQERFMIFEVLGVESEIFDIFSMRCLSILLKHPHLEPQQQEVES